MPPEARDRLVMARISSSVAVGALPAGASSRANSPDSQMNGLNTTTMRASGRAMKAEKPEA